MIAFNQLLPHFQLIGYSILGICAVGFIIGFHELGHFLFAKLFNVKTPSFSIGFGPKLIAKKIGETEFTLRAIPLGGFVEISGSAEIGQGEQKDAHLTDERSFPAKPLYQKLLILFGGILFNLIFAYGVMIALCWAGLPKTPIISSFQAQPIIETIATNSPAEKAHLQINDKIIGIDHVPIAHSVLPLLEYLEATNKSQITLEIERNQQQQFITVDVNQPASEQAAQQGKLGITFQLKSQEPQSFISGILCGIQLTNHYIARTISSWTSLFKKRNVSNMAGPIMIISMTVKGAAAGFKILLLFLAILSISLAVLNIFPLPILDGGQILFTVLEAIIGKPLSPRIKEYIFIASWVGILLLTLYLSAKDVLKLWEPFAQLFNK